MATCKARREGDQMCCGRCGIQWDVDDQDRPQCRTDKELSKEKGLQACKEMLHDLEADIVHKCNNCVNNKIHYCSAEQWTSGPGADTDALAILMNVKNDKCTKWRLKR